jgi:hypothetical protein
MEDVANERRVTSKEEIKERLEVIYRQLGQIATWLETHDLNNPEDPQERMRRQEIQQKRASAIAQTGKRGSTIQ